MTRYLKQHGSDYVTIWHPIAAKRKDMVEISEDEARKLLAEQHKSKEQRIADGTWAVPQGEPMPNEIIKPLQSVEPEVAGLKEPESERPEPKTTEAMPAEEPQPWFPDDPDIQMLEEIRRVGKGKARVEQYMMNTYGIDIDRRLRLDELVDQAIAKRIAELNKAAE